MNSLTPIAARTVLSKRSLARPVVFVTCDNNFDLCWVACNSAMLGAICVHLMSLFSSMRSANSSSNDAPVAAAA